MNDFGLVLPVGTNGVFKQARFYDTKASEKVRTFVIEGGVGREPEPGGRKLTGYWLEDGMKDTIDSYSLEYVILDGKKVKQLIKGDPSPEPVTSNEIEATEKRTNKPRGRSAWKDDEHGE